jgi:hypothetical protein
MEYILYERRLNTKSVTSNRSMYYNYAYIYTSNVMVRIKLHINPTK